MICWTNMRSLQWLTVQNCKKPCIIFTFNLIYNLNLFLWNTDVQPVDFVPYIEYKTALKVYQWIGAGRDSDGHLERLARFWLANR